MFKSTFSFRTMFSKMTKRKASSAMAEGTSSLLYISSGIAPNLISAQVVSSSNLSPEIEARINRLPKSWQAGCREVMEEQTPELQLIQFDIYEGLISLANSLSCPPLSSNIKEIVHEAPRPVDLNMDECLGWFRGTEGEYDDEEEEDEEDFDDDASCRWFPEEWRTSSELVSDSPRIIPNNLRQVKVSDSIIEHAPAFLDHSALPILISLPPSISSSFAVTCDIVKPLQIAVRTKRRNGISVAPARTAIPTPVVVRPSQPTKLKTVTLKRVNRRRSLSVRPSATQDWQRYCAKPLRTHRLPQDGSRELQGVEHSCQFPTDISYSDFAHELDERRTMFNGTSGIIFSTYL